MSGEGENGGESEESECISKGSNQIPVKSENKQVEKMMEILQALIEKNSVTTKSLMKISEKVIKKKDCKIIAADDPDFDNSDHGMLKYTDVLIDLAVESYPLMDSWPRL